MTAQTLWWTTDEDGERVHRLQAEWDGNKRPWWQWSRYRSEADETSLAAGATWSSWGLSVAYDWTWNTAWIAGRVPYRERTATVTVGPWYAVWRQRKPPVPARPEPVPVLFDAAPPA